MKIMNISVRNGNITDRISSGLSKSIISRIKQYVNRVQLVVIIVILYASFVFVPFSGAWASDDLMVLCGAALRSPMEDIIQLFQQKSGKKVYVTYGAVPFLMTQIFLAKKGDIIIAPSPDMMGRARARNLVKNETIRSFAFMAPSIAVQKGNPKSIEGLSDLARPGVRLAIANPEATFVGELSVEIFENNLSQKVKLALRKNIVTHAEDFSKLAAYLLLRQVDAIIGFHFLGGQYPDKIDIVKLNLKEIPRIGCAQAAVLVHNRAGNAARQFVEFLNSPEARDIIKKHHYFASKEDAFAWIGGVLSLSEDLIPCPRNG
jgi:molybdate transport system substrate-binding protein